MAKDKTEAVSIDVFIEEALSADPAKSKDGTGKKTTIKSLLKIPFTADKTNKALRVFGKNNEQKLYASVCIGTLPQTEEGYECNVTGMEAELVGNRFELTEVGTKIIVLGGKIAMKDAKAAKVVPMKEGTNG
ncbi:MAG: hypothetical protein HYS25_00885 [Ignavibacteriales bacterium]|nr:hypothetical protein [Ignavibacteriales bacterium]